MLPVVFRADWPVLLAGRGPALAKRLGVLEGAALGDLTVFTDAPEAALVARAGDRLRPGLPGPADIEAARLVFGAGLTPAESEALATAARARRIPVNIEDVPPLCDFHVPAMVRRGDLTLTVSTAGQAPALAAALRAWLEGEFGPDWEAHMREVAALRASLRAQGASPGEVIRGVARHLEGAGWAPLGRRAA